MLTAEFSDGGKTGALLLKFICILEVELMLLFSNVHSKSKNDIP